METPKHCAYNQTSDCILGMDVDAADFSDVTLNERIPQLTPHSGVGLWMVPFRGIPASGVRVPLDLLYLNRDCQVIDFVESFPNHRVSASSPTAASVLALPQQSISSSHTQLGDQLVVCIAAEMDRRMKRFTAATGFAPPGFEEASEFHQPPEGKNAKQKGWLSRWLSPNPPDPRRSPREPIPGLTAFFWTGGTPEPHAIRNVSSTGLYVVTEERWYPGTQIRLTLTKKDEGERGGERSLFVQAKAVRWGNDGVGLEFVLPDNRHLRRGEAPQKDGADRQDFEEFLEELRHRKGSKLQ
jgi:hypothetical protein